MAESRFAKLEKYIDSISEKYHVPASDITVYHGHEAVYRYIRGYSDAAGTKKASEDDRYILYSATKPLTAAAALQLIERGKLRLEDEIYRYLPEFEHMYVREKPGNATSRNSNGGTDVPGVVPAKRKITVEHLLTMRGGFNYDLKGEGILSVVNANPEATLSDVMKGLARQPLDFEPGTHFQYSLCHDVLAAVIEAASGMSYGQYMKENIFNPLGMDSAGYSTEEAYPYLTEQYAAGRGAVGAVNSYRFTPRYESGGAGLISTAGDYGKFVEAMCNYGVSSDGTRILTKESIDMMRRPRLDAVCLDEFFLKQAGYSYGLGVRTLVDKKAKGAKSPIGEFGWDGAAGAYVLMDVENRIGIFYAQQVLGGYSSVEMHMVIRDMVYDALMC